jgi:protein-S-isoprenylcysteine O-methyltransferase Ste14
MREIAKPILFELATVLGFILFGVLGFLADSMFDLRITPNWPYSYIAVPMILGGVALRFWASSTVFKTGRGTPLYSRPPTALVTTGPYRFIRNPLYLGGFLIYLGILVVIPSLLLGILGLVGLPIVYIGISREEKGLERRFGDDYLRYKESVPGWIPRISKGSKN